MGQKELFYAFFSKILPIFFVSVLIYEQFFPERKILMQQDRLVYLPDQKESVPLESEWIRLSEIPKEWVLYTVQVEDKRFYFHKGYSISDIHSAFISSVLFFRKMRGASTITQQLARTLFLSREKSLSRKWKEIQIASALEDELGKNMILEYYLNCVYWGRGMNGLNRASRYYFKKKPVDLDTNQFKALIQILKKPDAYTREEVISLSRIL
ncbi:biosynthetic peptidoglycan transglycosylase [Leptospira borgpetersenii]|nr:biosynthetic peptidoglycan transglycosylase [Leptospira borgpetersenii]ABJ74979.1 Penicillin-binding protein [Leptospira borgpetersenii serovar Hardjo-bovis str. JB197]ABJ80167.1 Penicillin-binding protein [Leptospira borgpetersenii serovar Hardjo-bovis str. L550]AMX59631.1 penicillin-binding protein [Leptospira borgpetersenii serovar Hardjo]AMX62859.1 penicillin-binding protein [Leptospira borgpetersenii serovar Hardjo]AMX66102.1 penicillin-binding protein [Leptospira borgpetersenii serova